MGYSGSLRSRTKGTRGGYRGLHGPILNLDFADGNGTLHTDISFTRASAATFFDKDGVLQTAASGAARVDAHVYDGTNWINRGFLLEEQRVWRALWNRDFTNAAWVKSNMGTAKDATGLDGVANSASTLTATAANATALQTVTIASAEFTHSIDVKRVTGSGDIDITDNNGTNWTTLTGLSSSLWTRHNITRTQANPIFGIRIVTDTDAVEVDFAGLEAGAFRTSRVEVTTAAVTRAQDVANMLTADIPGFDETLFSQYMEFSVPTIVTGRRITTFHDNSTSNRAVILTQGATGVRIFQANAGAGADFSGGIIANNTAVRVAVAWAVDDISAFLDGASLGSDTDVDMTSGVVTLSFGAGNDNFNQFNGFIARITLWNRRLSDGRLLGLTS